MALLLQLSGRLGHPGPGGSGLGLLAVGGFRKAPTAAGCEDNWPRSAMADPARQSLCGTTREGPGFLANRRARDLQIPGTGQSSWKAGFAGLAAQSRLGRTY